MKFQQIVAAVAILAAGAANASVQSFDSNSGLGTVAGNGSLILVKADTTAAGGVGGLTIDLGYNYNDFANGGALAGANTKIVWDFANNTITKNGSLVTGITNAWSAPFAAYAGNAADTKWTVLSGSQDGTNAFGFLSATSKVPTAAQLSQQNASVTGNMAGITDNLLGNAVNGIGNFGTFASADNGGYATGSADPGYVGSAYSVTTVNGWKNNIKWSTWSADGVQANLWQLNADGTEALVAANSSYTLGANDTLNGAGLFNNGGTFTLTGSTLTWQTATITTVTPSVPEPESFGLALVGLMALGFAARRRAAK